MEKLEATFNIRIPARDKEKIRGMSVDRKRKLLEAVRKMIARFGSGRKYE
jgi:hypothetical protein